MSSEEKRVAALKALQQVIIHGRTMTYEKAEYSKIANLMDRAEYLAALLYEREDRTAVFRANLEELAGLYRCSVVLVTFDAGY